MAQNSEKTSTWFNNIFCCPDCGTELQDCYQNRCPGCHREFINNDFRISAERHKVLSHAQYRSFTGDEVFNDIIASPPTITYHGPITGRDSRELVSVMEQHLNPGDRILDLGCGPRDQLELLTSLGYQYIGVDYSNQNADFLVDAHALPLKDAQFECVFAYAVMEHLHDPVLAISEVSRILKPGGIFVGVWSQGEPFHGSFVHATAWGLVSSFQHAPDMQIERLWPTMDTIKSLSRMGRYPKIIKSLLAAIDWLHQTFPILSPRKRNWSDLNKEIDAIHRAGSIGICVKKLN